MGKGDAKGEVNVVRRTLIFAFLDLKNPTQQYIVVLLCGSHGEGAGLSVLVPGRESKTR